MKKTYKDLKLIDFRKKMDLDFCHFTYKGNQCSCCYGPKDLPARYWKNGVIQKDKDFKYLLYKNANNGSGTRKLNDFVNDVDFISWGNMDSNELENVCKELSNTYGEDYIVLVPSDEYSTIIVIDKNDSMFNEYVSHYFKVDRYSMVFCNGTNVSNLYTEVK